MKMQNRLVSWLLRFSDLPWLRFMPAAIVFAVFIFGIVTFWTLRNPSVFNGRSTLTQVVYIDIIALLLLICLVVYRVLRMINPQSKDSASGLQRRLSVLFSILALVPAVIVSVFSLLFFDLGLKTWFSNKVSHALSESSQVAEAYLKEHRGNIVVDALGITRVISADLSFISPTDPRLEQALIEQGVARNLTEAIIFNLKGAVYARYGLTAALEFEPLSKTDIEKANEGAVVISTKKNSQRVRALIKIRNYPAGIYMIVGRFINPQVIAHVRNTKQTIAEYVGLEKNRYNLQLSFSITFILVVLLLLASAIWMGLITANTLTRPISLLIDATAKVGRGRYNITIDPRQGYDELGRLMKSFNLMTENLRSSTRELQEAYTDLDKRSNFIETLLRGLSTGVIALSVEGKIQFMNVAAKKLLDIHDETFSRRFLTECTPEFSRIVNSAMNEAKNQQQHIKIRAEEEKSLYVKVAIETSHKKIVGYIVSFDDVSLLNIMQKNTAWADVAKRMAHEIKNPLTPIQLAVERLRDKYLNKIPAADAEIFTLCINTIIRQVVEIEHLVDTFNAFARMPKASLIMANIVETIKRAFALQRAAHGHIKYRFMAPEKLNFLHDQYQIERLITNVMKNAYTSLVNSGNKSPEIVVHLTQQKKGITLCVEDNGDGFPKTNRDRLLDPYVSLDNRGIGLGLSIAQKIVEDHRGKIYLEDSKTGGGRVRIVL